MKTVDELHEEIYQNHKDNKHTINGLVESISKLVTSVDQATILAPLLSHFIAINVKNDAAIIELTKLKTKSTSGEESPMELVTPEELKDLLKLTDSKRKTKQGAM